MHQQIYDEATSKNWPWFTCGYRKCMFVISFTEHMHAPNCVYYCSECEVVNTFNHNYVSSFPFTQQLHACSWRVKLTKSMNVLPSGEIHGVIASYKSFHMFWSWGSLLVLHCNYRENSAKESKLQPSQPTPKYTTYCISHLLFEITQCYNYSLYTLSFCQQRSNWLFGHYRYLTPLLGKKNTLTIQRYSIV